MSGRIECYSTVTSERSTRLLLLIIVQKSSKKKLELWRSMIEQAIDGVYFGLVFRGRALNFKRIALAALFEWV